MRERFGPRTTLVDRYALEAEHVGVPLGDLDERDRRRLVDEVAPVLIPTLERAAGVGWSTDAVELVPYRPEWDEPFARRRERLLAELRAVAIRVEPVGSTAVPGLDAKPVVDVQVSVADVAEGAAYRPAIERAGVPFRMRERDHALFRPPDGEARTLHVTSGRPARRGSESTSVFRDHLRAHPAARDA
jgi:GrpB-like predicted nucleotidyltransferase (UPF0157 family)